MDVPVNFTVDRFIGGVALDGKTIGSIRISNASGNLELDELVFAVPVYLQPPGPRVVMRSFESMDLFAVSFSGILQSSDDLTGFADYDPPAVSPFIFSRTQRDRRFFRASTTGTQEQSLDSQQPDGNISNQSPGSGGS